MQELRTCWGARPHPKAALFRTFWTLLGGTLLGGTQLAYTRYYTERPQDIEMLGHNLYTYNGFWGRMPWHFGYLDSGVYHASLHRRSRHIDGVNIIG